MTTTLEVSVAHMKWKSSVALTRLCRVWAVRLGEGSRARASLARVLLLAGAPSPVVELLAVGLLAPPEHAHRPPRLLNHIHNAVQNLEDGLGSSYFDVYTRATHKIEELIR